MKLGLKYLGSLALFFSLSCAHQPISSLDRQIASLECGHALDGVDPSKPSSARDRFTFDDIKKMIAETRWQEAAWLLRQMGEDKRADALEAQIVKNFSTMEIVSIQPFDTKSISEIYLVTLKNGQKALFKLRPNFWKHKSQVNAPIAQPEAEMMTYRLVSAAGLPMVPVTVIRQLAGLQGDLQEFNGLEGSLQDFITRPLSTGDSSYSWSEMQDRELSRKLYEIYEAPGRVQSTMIYLIDYLVYNTDRNGLNTGLRWTFNLSTKLDPRLRPGVGYGQVDFDNGAALQEQFSALGNTPPTSPTMTNSSSNAYIAPEYIELYVPFFNGMRKLTPERIREIMAGFYSDIVIDQTIKRRNIILQFYEEASNMAKLKASGLRVNGVQRGGLFEKMHLVNGDVVVAINGVPVKTLEEAEALYASRDRSADNFAMIIRNNTEQRITIR